MKKPITTLLLAAAAAFACGLGLGAGGLATANDAAPPAASDPAAATAPENVLARVNGAPITEADLRLKLQDNHESTPTAEHRKNALDTLITREILAQKARAAGLDRDPKYQEAARKAEAQVRAHQRQELSELLIRRETERRAAPTEAEARAHFEKNRAQMGTQVHVLQILRRSEAAIMEVRNAIQAGESFEEAAASLFPGLPQGQRPWDLGYLSFHKVPEPWRDTVYDLKPGEMSGILRGPNERYWLVLLVETRADPGMTFESVKEAVLADLTRNRLQRSREALESELREGAQVELLLPAP